MRITALSRKLRFSLNGRGYPLLYALLFGAAFVATLFFNGMRIELFALSLILLMLLFYAVLWRGYARSLHIPKTPLSIALTLFWAWLAITLLWTSVPYVSMVNFWWVGGAVLVFWLIALLPEGDRPYPGIYIVVLGIGVVLALLSFYQQLRLGVQAQSTFLTRNSHAGLMCLIAIPASSHFLFTHGQSRLAPWTNRILGPVLFALYFSIALTSSRGATVGLLTGLAVVLWLAYTRVPRARLAVFLGIIVTAYVAANFLLQGEVANRLGTLVEMTEADPQRLLIWRQSWRMLMDDPWWGVGLGTYWLHWPPYRHPQDASAGFYVHNDYLQLWIETGIPGLLLLFGIYVAVVVTFVRILRHANQHPAVIVESAGLFGGLLAIAVHTFLDFHLYIHPIQLAMGLVLVRLHALYLKHVPADVLIVTPASRIAPRPYRVISFLVVLLPLIYFIALGLSAILTYKARELSAQGKWVDASVALSRAAQLMPTSDLVLTAHADLLRQALSQLPPGSDADRRTVYREALALLNDSEKVNPLRPQVYFIRGLLYQQTPDLTGPDWADRAARAYIAALKQDPMAFWAREAYAGLLLRQGKLMPAKEVLEGGIDYRYASGVVVEYYAMLAWARREAGETGRAEALERKISEITGKSVRPFAEPLLGPK